MLARILARKRENTGDVESRNFPSKNTRLSPRDGNRAVNANVAYPFRDEKSTSFPAPLSIDASVLTDRQKATTSASKDSPEWKQQVSQSDGKEVEERKKEETKEKKKKSKKDKEVKDEEPKDDEPDTCPPETCNRIPSQKVSAENEIIPNKLTEMISSSIKEAMENIVKKCSVVPEMQEPKSVSPKSPTHPGDFAPCKKSLENEYQRKLSKRRDESREGRRHRREKFDECDCSPRRKRSSKEKKPFDSCYPKDKIHEERSKKYSKLQKNLKSDNRRMTGNVNIYICSEATENKQDTDKEKKQEKPCAESSSETASNCTYSNTACSSSSKLLSNIEKRRKKGKDERRRRLDCLCEKVPSYSEDSSAASSGAWRTDYKNSRSIKGRWDNDPRDSRETSSGDIDDSRDFSTSSTRDGCLCNDTNFSGTNMAVESDASISRSRFTTCNRQGPYRPNDSRVYPVKSEGSSNESDAWEPRTVCTNVDRYEERKSSENKYRESFEDNLERPREEMSSRKRRKSYSRKRERYFGDQKDIRSTCACIAEEEEECLTNVEKEDKPKEPLEKIVPCPALSKPSAEKIIVCSNVLSDDKTDDVTAKRSDDLGNGTNKIEGDESEDSPKHRRGLLRSREKLAKSNAYASRKPSPKENPEEEPKIVPPPPPVEPAKATEESSEPPENKRRDSFFRRSLKKAIGMMNSRKTSEDNSGVKANNTGKIDGDARNDKQDSDKIQKENIRINERPEGAKNTGRKKRVQKKTVEQGKSGYNTKERPKTKLELILEGRRGYRPNVKSSKLLSSLKGKYDNVDETRSTLPQPEQSFGESSKMKRTAVDKKDSKEDVQGDGGRYRGNSPDDRSDTKWEKKGRAEDRKGGKYYRKGTTNDKEEEAYSKQEVVKKDGVLYVPCESKKSADEPVICRCKTTDSDVCSCTCPECKNCKKPEQHCCCVREETKKEICNDYYCPMGNHEKSCSKRSKGPPCDVCQSTERLSTCGPCCKAKEERPVFCENCCRPKVNCQCKKMLVCVACCRPKADCRCRKPTVCCVCNKIKAECNCRGPIMCPACCKPKIHCRCRKTVVCVNCCKPVNECRCRKPAVLVDCWDRKSMICVYCDHPRDCCTCRLPVQKCSYCGMLLNVCNCKDPETCSREMLAEADNTWKPRRDVRRYFSRNVEDVRTDSAEECRCHEKSKPYGCEELPYQRLRVFSNVMNELQQKMSESVCCTRCRRIPCCCGIRVNKNEEWKEGKARTSPKSRRKIEYCDDGKRSRIPEGCRCGGSSGKNDQQRCSQPLRVCCICRTTPCRCRKTRSAPKRPRAKCYYCKNSPCICTGTTETNKARPCRCSSLPHRVKDEEIVSRSKQPTTPKTEGKLICVRESEVSICPASRKHRRRENSSNVHRRRREGVDDVK